MESAATPENKPKEKWWTVLRLRLIAHLQQREEQIFLLLSLLIGALTGFAVVAFIVVTERLGMRLYPVGSAAWRRVPERWAAVVGCWEKWPRRQESARASTEGKIHWIDL